ncbi:uncharacterized protein LOC122497809 isoform X3 [Leptopilina heterotoma]|uniref:uncharacterized protein LOC122497809 isoform X3 n=1 Tax=Leptopilina heterotoma TaxID=63436 RepID=UPI001CA8CD90|nr:uncharacterized protein LOC122497809 isoform X3 [Leptopilina heterotoma]
MFQDEGTTIKRELEDDESNGVLEENEVALKKQRTEEVLIKEEEVEIDEDNCIEKSNENNAEDNCEANKNTGNSSERNLQNQNPLEDSFWVQDGLFFEEQDPITLTTNNFPSIAEKPTTSTGASTCQRNDKISYQATRNQELTKGESKYDKESICGQQNSVSSTSDETNVPKSETNFEFLDVNEFVETSEYVFNNKNNSTNTTQDLLEKEPEKFASNLISFLKNDLDGKIVFGHFKRHKFLDKETRGILVRTIIRKFRDDALKTIQVGQKLNKFFISTKMFGEISKIIKKTFPGEAECTYFSPYKFENGKTFQTCGALWCNYQYTVSVLRKKGILEPPRLKQSSTEGITSPLTPSDELRKEALSNLEKGLNEDTLLQDWITCFINRKNLLSENKLSVKEYLDKFPCLKTQHALKLIEEDFKLLQSESKCNTFRTRWSTIKKVTINQLNMYAKKSIKKRKDENVLADLALIKLLPSLHSNQQDAIVLHLLQLLVNCNSSIGRRKRDGTSEEFKKYDSCEIRESFIYNVKKIEDLEKEIESLKNKCLARGEILLPTVFIIGELSAISEAYVILNNEKYKCDSIISAFDFAFKTFFSFNCTFPKVTYRLWQFIQVAGFDIPDDKSNKSIKELVGLIEEALKNPEQ